MWRLFIFILILTHALVASAAEKKPEKQTTNKIEFPRENLASESVLPVFDEGKAVRQRLIRLEERFELGVFGGSLLSEPFYSPYNYGAMGTYYFDSVRGLNVAFNLWASGDSTYKKQLEAGNLLNLEGGPEFENMLTVSYQHTAWYGKMSWTKNGITHLHLYLLAGAGALQAGDQWNPLINFGFGQKFYFARNWAFRFDLRGLAYQAPNPLSITIPVGAPPDTSAFDKRVYFNSLLTLGLTVLL